MSCATNLASELERFSEHLGVVEVAGLDEHGLRVATSGIRNLERAAASLKLRIGQRANQLAAAGAGADAGAVLLGVGDVSAGTARKEAARADVVDTMPSLGSALADGLVGAEHLDAIARTARSLDEPTRQALAGLQDGLVEAAGRMPVDTFNRHLRREVDRIRHDHGLSRALQQRARSELKYWIDKDGMGQLHATLDPERYAVAVEAIDRQMTAVANAADGPVTKGPHLAVEALMDLISHGNGRHGRAHVTLVVDAETALHGPHEHSVRQTVDGAELPPETIDRFCCDAVIRKVVIDKRGVPIDVGRSARTATDGQWAALKAIHSTCGWKDCDRPVSWCQAHHIKEWDPHPGKTGGLTDLENLVPLCNRHHHAVHEGKWSIKLLPDRTLQIRKPDNQHWANAKPDRLRESTRAWQANVASWAISPAGSVQLHTARADAVGDK